MSFVSKKRMSNRKCVSTPEGLIILSNTNIPTFELALSYCGNKRPDWKLFLAYRNNLRSGKALDGPHEEEESWTRRRSGSWNYGNWLAQGSRQTTWPALHSERIRGVNELAHVVTCCKHIHHSLHQRHSATKTCVPMNRESSESVQAASLCRDQKDHLPISAPQKSIVT